jgi:muconolactone delta-isomerase
VLFVGASDVIEHERRCQLSHLWDAPTGFRNCQLFGEDWNDEMDQTGARRHSFRSTDPDVFQVWSLGSYVAARATKLKAIAGRELSFQRLLRSSFPSDTVRRMARAALEAARTA